MEEKETAAAVPPARKTRRHSLLLVLVMGLVLVLAGQLLGEVITLLLRRMAHDTDSGVRFLFTYLAFIGIDILVLVYCGLFEKEIFRSFLSSKHRGGRGNTGRYFALGLLIGFGMNGLSILPAWLHGDLHFSAGRFEWLYMIAALLCVCVQSGAEELVTRGYMMSALRERYGVRIAVAVNALFFAVLHLLNPGITVLSVLEIVVIGFALSLVVYYLDSLWMAVAIHTAWNFTQNFLFGLPNSGIVSRSSFLRLEAAANSVFYDTSFGVEGSITAVAVSGLLAAAVFLYARRKRASDPSV